MIYRVEITNQIAANLTVAHHFEQVVDDVEEAAHFGQHCAHLMQAYHIGFGDAELEDDG